MSNIFIGPSSTFNINHVFSQLKNKRIKDFNRSFHHNTSFYHPFINHFDTASQIDNSFILRYFDKCLVTNFPESYLVEVERILTNQTFLLGFGGTNPQFSVFSDVSTKIRNFQEEIESAISIISSSCDWIWQTFQNTIQSIIPVMINGQPRGVGGSSDYYLTGMFFFGLYPDDFAVEKLAISFSHELAHNCLMVYQAGQTPIKEEDWNRHVYSGVRKTLRPTMGSLHAAAALGYMASFCFYAAENQNLSILQRKFFRDLYKEYRTDLREGLIALADVKLNSLGKRITKELRSIT